jgi:hypothetical protein
MQAVQAIRNGDKKKPTLTRCRRNAHKLQKKSGHERLDRSLLSSCSRDRNMSDLKNVRNVMGTGNRFRDDANEATVQYQAARAHRQPRIVYSHRRISALIHQFARHTGRSTTRSESPA